MKMDLNRMITFLSSVPGLGVIQTDGDYVVREISESALRMLNCGFTQVVQRDLRAALPRLFQEGCPPRGHIKFGGTQYLNVRELDVREEDYKLILLQDVTKTVLHDVYEQVLNFLHEATIISGADSCVVHVNDAATRLEGLTNQDAAGRPLRDIYKLEEESDYLSIRAMREKKRLLNERQVYSTMNGKMLDSLVSAYPIYLNDELFGAVCITEDYARIDTLTKKIIELQGIISNSNQKGGKKCAKSARYTFNDIVSRDPRMISCVKKCKMAARSDSAVLIDGATGTGKELFAQSIHNFSRRADQPFIAVNCAAIPENLLEGMLFGTVKGAFTGAENRIGLFEQANGGTLLLDEINSMPLALQAKLLRVLQDGCIRRLGDIEERRVNVRIISNINTPPQEALRNKELRQDLFYRLGVVSISIPPLRERAGDIELLAKSFILQLNETMGKAVVDIAPETAAIFQKYAWPGNVRELRHAIEHAMNVIPDGKALIRPAHLPANMIDPAWEQGEFSAPPAFANTSPVAGGAAKMDQGNLLRALDKNDYNITKTALYLGISRQNLQYRLKKHQIHVERLRPDQRG